MNDNTKSTTAVLVALVTLALAVVSMYSANEAKGQAAGAQATLSSYVATSEAALPPAGVEAAGYTGFFGVAIDHNNDQPAIKIRQRGNGVAIQIQNATGTPIAEMSNSGQWSVPFQHPLITGTATPTSTSTKTSTPTSTSTPTGTPTNTPSPTAT